MHTQTKAWLQGEVILINNNSKINYITFLWVLVEGKYSFIHHQKYQLQYIINIGNKYINAIKQWLVNFMKSYVADDSASFSFGDGRLSRFRSPIPLGGPMLHRAVLCCSMASLIFWNCHMFFKSNSKSKKLLVPSQVMSFISTSCFHHGPLTRVKRRAQCIIWFRK